MKYFMRFTVDGSSTGTHKIHIDPNRIESWDSWNESGHGNVCIITMRSGVVHRVKPSVEACERLDEYFDSDG